MNLSDKLKSFLTSDRTLGEVINLVVAMAENEIALEPYRQAVATAKPEEKEAKIMELFKAKEGIDSFGRDDEVGLV